MSVLKVVINVYSKANKSLLITSLNHFYLKEWIFKTPIIKVSTLTRIVELFQR